MSKQINYPLPTPTSDADLLLSSYSCLICVNSIQKKGTLNSKQSQDLFQRICSIMKVELLSGTWDFGSDAFPFCASCIKAIQQLIHLQDKLESIKKDIDVGIKLIRSKLGNSDQKFISSDLRIIGFRSQIRGAPLNQQQLPFPENIMQQQSYNISSEVHNVSNPDASNSFLPITSDFPLHELRNAQEEVSSFGDHSLQNSCYHPNIFNTTNNVNSSGLTSEAQIGTNECSLPIEGDNDLEMLDDNADCFPSSPSHNADGHC